MLCFQCIAEEFLFDTGPLLNKSETLQPEMTQHFLSYSSVSFLRCNYFAAFWCNVLSTVLFGKLTKSPVCFIRPKKGEKQKQKVSSIFLFFVTVALWACLPVPFAPSNTDLWRRCVGTPPPRPPLDSRQLSSEPRELFGWPDSPFFLNHLFRNKTVCTGVDCYLSTSFLPFLGVTAEEKMQRVSFTCILPPMGRFSLAATTVQWKGIYERAACSPDKCVRRVAETEKGFVTAENGYLISNAREILPSRFCVICCTW